MNTPVLPWINENTLTPYPLVKSFGYDGFITDAQFIQFDNFIPSLTSIKLVDDNVQLRLVIDSGIKTFTYTTAAIITPGAVQYLYDEERYIGTLVFGSGVNKLVTSKGNQTTINVGTAFLSHLVKSIPVKAGIYSVDSFYGDLTFSSDEYISYDTVGNDITFNAISTPPIINENYLKTLNSVGPLDNSVFIKNTDIIKVTGGDGVVTISLVGNAPGGLTQTNSIIVTSDGG